MTPLGASLIAGALIVAASGIGALTVFGALKNTVEKRLPLLVSFSSGVFVVLVVSLLVESEELIGSIPPVALLAVFGAVFVWGLSRLIPESHHHHSGDDHSHSRPDARRMLIGDSIHNMGDGIVLITAFTFDFQVGIATTIAVLIHEAAQEISEFFVLRAAGYSIKEALVQNALVAGTIFIGMVVGAFLSGTDTITGIILAIAAGAFAFIIAEDLIPHSIQQANQSRSPFLHVGAALVGVAAMVGVGLITPHSHDHESAGTPVPADTESY